MHQPPRIDGGAVGRWRRWARLADLKHNLLSHQPPPGRFLSPSTFVSVSLTTLPVVQAQACARLPSVSIMTHPAPSLLRTPNDNGLESRLQDEP